MQAAASNSRQGVGQHPGTTTIMSRAGTAATNATVPSSSSSSARKILLAQQPDKHPYLDKLVMKINIPEDVPGHNDFVSISHETFPDLYRYTGIKSAFEPPSVPTTDGHGTLTPQYKIAAFETLKPIVRDERELTGRVPVFQRSHRQFIDDVMKDMEHTHSLQASRQMKYWSKNKDKLGFADSFNSMGIRNNGSGTVSGNSDRGFCLAAQTTIIPPTTTTTTPAETTAIAVGTVVSADVERPQSSLSGDGYLLDEFESSNLPEKRGSSPLSSPQPPIPPHKPLTDYSRQTQHNHHDNTHSNHRNKTWTVTSKSSSMLDRPKIGVLPENSSSLIRKIGHRPPNKMALFNALLDTTPAPKSPRKCYGTVDFSNSSNNRSTVQLLSDNE
jgi:hypothetical protein